MTLIVAAVRGNEIACISDTMASATEVPRIMVPTGQGMVRSVRPGDVGKRPGGQVIPGIDTHPRLAESAGDFIVRAYEKLQSLGCIGIWADLVWIEQSRRTSRT